MQKKEVLTVRDFKKLTGLHERVIQRLAKKGLIGEILNSDNNHHCPAYIFDKSDAEKSCVKEAQERIRKK